MSSSPNAHSLTNNNMWKDSEVEAMRSRSVSLGSSGRSDVVARDRSEHSRDIGGSHKHEHYREHVHHAASHHRERERERREERAGGERGAEKIEVEKERARSGSSLSTVSTSPPTQFTFDAYTVEAGYLKKV
jgi:hypothetical protein